MKILILAFSLAFSYFAAAKEKCIENTPGYAYHCQNLGKELCNQNDYFCSWVTDHQQTQSRRGICDGKYADTREYCSELNYITCQKNNSICTLLQD